MNEDVRALRRELQQLREQVSRLESRARQSWTQPGSGSTNNVEVRVAQTAHGFERGHAVSCLGGVWSLYTTDFNEFPAFGIVTSVLGPDAFVVTLAGTARVHEDSDDLVGGDVVGFNAGLAVLWSSQYPPYAAVSKVQIVAAGVDTVKVEPCWYTGWQQQNGVFTTITKPGGDTFLPGYYVVYAGYPSSPSTLLALADEANPWRWTHVGIAVCEIGGAGLWLVLTHGACSWSQFGVSDGRAAWQKVAPWNAGQRIALSTGTPGAYQTAIADEPTFKVFVGQSSAGWTPASPPNPSAFTLTAHAVGQGVPYPIPPSGGGTGTDVALLNEHAVLFMDTYGDPGLESRKIAGLLSATSNYAVVVQKNSEQPTHLALDLAATGSFVANSGNLYAAAGGKRFATTAPTDKQFLRYNGTDWSPYGPLLTAVGQTLGHNGTDLVTVDCSTATSVIGRSAGSAGAFAPIAATANNQILARISGSLQWLAAPSTSGHVLQYNGTTLTWAAVSGLPTVTTSDEGKMLYVDSAGTWQNTRDVYLGDNPLTASSVQGSFGVVKSSDGDYIKLSSGGVEIFDRSVSTGTALIKIDIGHASLNATGRALSVREIDVCDAGVAKKMLVLASAPY